MFLPITMVAEVSSLDEAMSLANSVDYASHGRILCEPKRKPGGFSTGSRQGLPM